MNTIIQITKGELFMILVSILAMGTLIGYRYHQPAQLVMADPLCLFTPSASSTNPLNI